jgi:hypothetical protein
VAKPTDCDPFHAEPPITRTLPAFGPCVSNVAVASRRFWTAGSGTIGPVSVNFCPAGALGL